jgi:hypothetical protein
MAGVDSSELFCAMAMPNATIITATNTIVFKRNIPTLLLFSIFTHFNLIQNGT